MPNSRTFSIPPVKELLDRYVKDGKGWVDAFAGDSSRAEITNDINPSTRAMFHFDALYFLSRIEGQFEGILHDPPYSITQAKLCYDSYGSDKLGVSPNSMKYWSSIKNRMTELIKPSGLAICCGWTSMGLGVNRGFSLLEILLVPHGGSKNDTIVTVEMRTGTWT